MARLFPDTRKYSWFMVSGNTGLTLPGMMDEPFCSSPKVISAMPPLGPLAMNRKSVAILERSTHRAVTAWDMARKSVWLEVWDIKFDAGLKFCLVFRESAL